MKKMPNRFQLHQWQIDEASDIARKRLSAEPGSLEESPHDYQLWVYREDNVCLVFYPHRTKSTGNYHIRVRDQGSKDKERAVALMDALDEAAGYNCTFTRKI